jgi:hypothetical protein
MATLPPESTLPRAQTSLQAAPASGAHEAAWLALHRQAGELAKLARIAAEPAKINASFSRLIADARPWQHTMLEQGLEDVAAMLESGMAALMTLSGRGQDTTAPALALWREFHAARGALLAVLYTDESS